MIGESVETKLWESTHQPTHQDMRDLVGGVVYSKICYSLMVDAKVKFQTVLRQTIVNNINGEGAEG